MADIAAQRLRKELADMNKSDDFNSSRYKIETVGNSLFHMIATIAGPPDTPYAGGTFRVDLKMTTKYPFVPPKASFLTAIWHPNISSRTGCICLDILDKNWAAALTIRGVLLSLQSLLQDPEPDNPLDAVVANQYKSNRDLFGQTARYWTAVYAIQDPALRKHFVEFEAKVKQLANIAGPKHSEDKLVSALSAHDWNVPKALDALLD